MSGLRLRAELRGKPIRLDVPAAGGLLGSGSECELVLADPTVSRRHARLLVVDQGLEIHDLGSTNGTWLDGRRVEQAIVAPGSTVLFGRVSVTVDGVPAADRVVALPLVELASDGGADPGYGTGGSPTPAAGEPLSHPRQSPPSLLGVGAETTVGLGPLDAIATGLIPRLLEQLWLGADASAVAQLAGTTLLGILPLVELEVREERGNVLFRGGSGMTDPAAAPVERRRGHVLVRAAFAHSSRGRALAPLVDIVALVVALAADRERPLPRGADPEPPPLPGEGSTDPAVLAIYAQALRVARGDVGVLILGESGTGKEVLARFLHRASGRPTFVALNCAALPRDLLEAELFGVEKGTATGVDPRPGKLEMAHEGTLFLDEIGDMSLETQAKILRVLQEGEVFRLGASRPRPARARVLAATNKPVRALVQDGAFRLDLYHRIAGWVVELPPLRARVGDVPNLAVRFLAEEGRKLGRRFRGISQGALDRLVACPWPGNIRQLRQEIARCALFLDDGGVLEASLLGADVGPPSGSSTAAGEAAGELAARVEAFERREIEQALAATGGGVAEAARRLGVHRATLYRRMKQLGLAGEA